MDHDRSFDIVSHKKKYIHYFEVIVLEDGTVEYAFPSHQEYMIELACKKLGCTRTELMDMTPTNYFFDMIVWLSGVTGAMAVWEDSYECYNCTQEQRAKLSLLGRAGLYFGCLPDVIKRKEIEMIR